MITDVGKFLDPLADKATQFALIICLAIKYPALRILCGLFILKETAQVFVCLTYLRKGNTIQGSLLGGKISTTFLFVSLILMVLFPDMDQHIVNALALADGLFLCAALLDYITTFLGKRKTVQE